MHAHKHAHRHIICKWGHRRAWRKEREFGRGQLEDTGGVGLREGYSFCPRQYREAWQPISASWSHPHNLTTPLPSPPPTRSALPWSSELRMVRAGMLKQFMFTCTSKVIKYKPPGLRWVWGPSHLGLTSWKHLASSCHNSIQVHLGLTQAPPLLMEVIPDYRATVVKCWYNVFFLFFFPVSLFVQLFFNSGTSRCAGLVWLTFCKIDISFQFNIHELHIKFGWERKLI